MSQYWKLEDMDEMGGPRPTPGMKGVKVAKGGEKTAPWPGPPGKTGAGMNGKVKAPKVKTYVKGSY